MLNGLSKEDALNYIQNYKTVREIISENEKIMSSKIISNNGTWITDR